MKSASVAAVGLYSARTKHTEQIKYFKDQQRIRRLHVCECGHIAEERKSVAGSGRTLFVLRSAQTPLMMNAGLHDNVDLISLSKQSKTTAR